MAIDSTAHIVKDAQVYFGTRNIRYSQFNVDSCPFLVGSQKTDSDGVFALPMVNPGIYWLEIRDSLGRGVRRCCTLSVSQPSLDLGRIVIKPCGSISGNILSNHYDQGYTIFLNSPLFVVVNNDIDGHFTITNLYEGTYRFFIAPYDRIGFEMIGAVDTSIYLAAGANLNLATIQPPSRQSASNYSSYIADSLAVMAIINSSVDSQIARFVFPSITGVCAGRIVSLYSAFQLGRLTPDISRLTGLQYLRFISDKKDTTTSFPAEVLSLSNLWLLELTEMGISELPMDLERLNNLKVLSLRENKLSSVSEQLKPFASIIALELDGNRICSPSRQEESWLDNHYSGDWRAQQKCTP